MILVVEDDPLVRRLVVKAMQMTGYQVCEAVDGLDAQHQFALRSPDLVLTDLHMPGLDGEALVEWVRTQKPIPIVIMTAAAAPAGIATSVLGKPFTIQALTETVQHALHGTGRLTTDLTGRTLPSDPTVTTLTAASPRPVASHVPRW